MKTIEVKRQLLEEALDQLKGAQQDCYVLSTQDVINELEVVLRQPDVSGSLPMNGFQISVIENNVAAQDGKALLMLSSRDYKEYTERLKGNDR